MWDVTNILPAGFGPTPDIGLTQLLLESYPNSYYGSMHVRYVLSERTKVLLRVLDILRRESTMLVDHVQTTGPYSVRFDTSHLPSGMDFRSFQPEKA